MANANRIVSRRLMRNKFLFLLISLVAALTAAPLFEKQLAGRIIQYACITAVFVTSILANRNRRWVFVTGIAIAVIAVPLTWSTLVLRNDQVSLAQYLFWIALLGMTAAMILIAVFKDHLATSEAVLGAICVYLLVGLCWAVVYAAVEYVEAEPFVIAHRRTVAASDEGAGLTAFSQLVYYSFVTLSTLGFGDITPRTPLAQTMTWMEAVAGQFYLAVLVARLVGALPRPSDDL